tara:strand:+ start:285 stop:413 length:129 start_codon:yes stop_codon:yes gene_type:complete
MNKDEKKTLNIKKTLDLAIENHQKNNLKTAEQLLVNLYFLDF